MNIIGKYYYWYYLKETKNRNHYKELVVKKVEVSLTELINNKKVINKENLNISNEKIIFTHLSFSIFIWNYFFIFSKFDFL